MKIRTKIISRWQHLKDSDSCIPIIMVIVIIASAIIGVAIHGCLNVPK